ncbi:MAG: prepilin-type N-terminal cleavage/methylation domain-containing protein [Candidatus Omnitrophica bacterium]|nr:prepilin-type N-terminal cleavage/methylation domain-containing protein [Candidatus Omnitrophota bacterium]
MKEKNSRRGTGYSKRGFTFIELLIVTAILAVISLAIYTTFNNGIKIWQKVNTRMSEQELDIFFEYFSSDLRNSFSFTGIGFLGKEDSLQFPTLVDSKRLGSKTVGQVIYSYNSMAGIIDREERDFSQIYADRRGIITQSLDNVKSLIFQYYFYDEKEKEYIWYEKCLEEKIPLAVRMILEFNDNSQGGKFTKTISIPFSS